MSSTKAERVLYLDGLRGLASLLVYWHHHQLWYHASSRLILEMGFGFRNEYHLATFPVIRTFFTGGHFSVALLFVISGYALAVKPLLLIHAMDYQGLVNHLASAIARRWLRLYIPFACTTFIFMSLCHLLGAPTPGFRPLGSWWEEAQAWFSEFRRFSFIFDDAGSPWFSYNNHLWSVPVEFKGSMVVYITCLATSRFSLWRRILALCGLILYHLYAVDGWYSAYFLAGMLLCQLNLIQHDRRQPQRRQMAGLQMLGNFILLFVGFYLAGVPHCAPAEYLGENRGWYFLSRLTPDTMVDPKWFYLFWASTFVLVAISQVPILHAFLCSSHLQYLGWISHGVYLVHGPVLWILGRHIYDPLQRIKYGWPLGLEVNFLTAQLVMFPVTLCFAEAVTLGIDEPSIRIVSDVYKWFCGNT